MADPNTRLILNSQPIEDAIRAMRAAMDSAAVPFVWDKTARKDFAAWIPHHAWISGSKIPEIVLGERPISDIGGVSRFRTLILGSDIYFAVLLKAERPIPAELWTEISDGGFVAGVFPSWGRILA